MHFISSVKSFPSMSAKPEYRWAILVGSCIVWSTESDLTGSCQKVVSYFRNNVIKWVSSALTQFCFFSIFPFVWNRNTEVPQPGKVGRAESTFGTFFSETSSGKKVPRALFVDLEPSVVGIVSFLRFPSQIYIKTQYSIYYIIQYFMVQLL